MLHFKKIFQNLKAYKFWWNYNRFHSAEALWANCMAYHHWKRIEYFSASNMSHARQRINWIQFSPEFVCFQILCCLLLLSLLLDELDDEEIISGGGEISFEYTVGIIADYLCKKIAIIKCCIEYQNINSDTTLFWWFLELYNNVLKFNSLIC